MCTYLNIPPSSVFVCSASYGAEVAVSGDLNNLPSDRMMDMDVAMDTGQSFSDLMDIIKGDSTGTLLLGATMAKLLAFSWLCSIANQME